MKTKLLIASLFLSAGLYAQQTDVYAPWRESWAEKAEQAKPKLKETIYRPLYLVEGVKDSLAYQGWRMEKSGEMSSYYGVSLKQVPCVTVDFGKHMTGHFTFRIKTLSRTQDAPLRLRFTFGEVPAEMNTPFDPFPGTLSRAWMQDEVVTVEQIDCDITIPRRISGRYMKVRHGGHVVHCRVLSRPLLGGDSSRDSPGDHTQNQ